MIFWSNCGSPSSGGSIYNFNQEAYDRLEH